MLDPDRISASQNGAPIGRRVLVFRETASTNDIALSLGSSDEPEGTVIFALSQTSGRGQFGRNWHSAPNLGLWFSILLRPQWPASALPNLTPLTAVAIAEALATATGLPTQIKPPNDIHIRRRKVAGILTEARSGARIYAALGIGINVNQSETDFPASLRSIATSLSMEAGHPFDLETIGIGILTALNARYPATSPNDPGIHSRYTALSQS